MRDLELVPFAKLTILGIFASLGASSANAIQMTDTSSCNAALAKDVSTTVRTQEQDLDFLSVVDKHTFEEAKASNSFGATVPLADDLLGISDNFAQFSQKRTDYFSKIHYAAHYREGEYQHIEVTSAAAYPAWNKCIEALARSSSDGLFVWKTKDDENSMVVNVLYKVPAISARRFKTVVLKGKTQAGNAPVVNLKPDRIQTEQTKNFVIPRLVVNGTPQPLLVTFEAGVYAGDTESEWRPPPPPTTNRTGQVPASLSFSTTIYTMFVREQQGHLTLKGASFSVPNGTIQDSVASVDYRGCDGGGCGWVHYVPGGQNYLSPDHKTVTVSVATDYSGSADLPLHFAVNYLRDVTVCVGRDKKDNGEGCPVQRPSEVIGR